MAEHVEALLATPIKRIGNTAIAGFATVDFEATLDDDPAEATHFLRTTGYLVVRSGKETQPCATTW